MIEHIRRDIALGTAMAALVVAAPPVQGQDQLPFGRVLGCEDAGTGSLTTAIDLSGLRAILGEPGGSSQPGLESGCTAPSPPGVLGSGAAYVHEWDGFAWAVQALLTAADATSGDGFGCAVALDGDVAVVGAPYSGEQGAAYVFERRHGAWTQVAKLTPPPGPFGTRFGWSVDVDADTIVVGDPDVFDPNDCEPGDTNTGAAYVYHRLTDVWTLEARLTACPLTLGDGDPPLNGCENVVFQEVHSVAPAGFGGSLSVSGDLLVVGAPESQVGAFCPPAGPGAGAAFLFVRSLGAWDDGSVLLPQESQALANFGFDVALDGATVVVGQPFFDQTLYDEDGEPIDLAETGAAAIFDVELSLAQLLTYAPPIDGDDTRFGFSVAVDDHCTILVGAPGNPAVDLAGAVYVYRHEGIASQPSWPFHRRLVSDDDTENELGRDIAVEVRTALAATSPSNPVLDFIITDPYSALAPSFPDDGFDGPCLEWADVPNETVAEYDCTLDGGRYTIDSITPIPDAPVPPTVVASRNLDVSFLNPENMDAYDPRWVGYEVYATISWTQDDSTSYSDARVALDDDAFPFAIASVAVAEHPSGLPRVLGIVNPTGQPGGGIAGWGTLPLPLNGSVQLRITVMPAPQPGLWRYETLWRLTDEDEWEAVSFADADRTATLLIARTQAHADPAIPFGPVSWEWVRAHPVARLTCPGDTNSDGIVDVLDLVAIILAWGPVACGHPWDWDHSLAVDVSDLVTLILNWGPCPG